MTEQTKAQQHPTTKHQAGLSTRRISSQELFASKKELLIEHVGIEYRLRITRQNKLILTK